MRGQEHPVGIPLWAGRHSVEHVEAIGRGLAAIDVTEDYLVGAVAYLGEAGKPDAQAATSAELHRRLLVAIRDFNEQSKVQTDSLIAPARESSVQTARVVTLTENLERLTARLFWLSIIQLAIAAAVGAIAAVQLWAMLKGGA